VARPADQGRRPHGREGDQLDGADSEGRGDRSRAFRRHTLLPLDDCLHGLQPVGRGASSLAPEPFVIASLLSAALHQLPAGDRGDKPQKKRFANYPLGYVYIDLAEVST
jgi:hypothetical protein